MNSARTASVRGNIERESKPLYGLLNASIVDDDGKEVENLRVSNYMSKKDELSLRGDSPEGTDDEMEDVKNRMRVLSDFGS